MNDMKCELDAEGHCITCSDEATAATVQRIDQETGVAFVTIDGETEEVDISLIDDVSEGDLILVHGGVAIGVASAAVILRFAQNDIKDECQGRGERLQGLSLPWRKR